MLQFRSIRWKLIVSSLLAVGIPLILFGYFLGSQLMSFYLRQVEAELRSKARHVAESTGPILDPRTPADAPALTRAVHRWKNYPNIRVTVADLRGIVQATTNGSGVGDPLSDVNRPGMLQALHGDENSMVWKNPDYGNEDSIYVNMPVKHQDKTVGVVRVAQSLTQVQQSIGRVRATLVTGFAAYGALIIALTFLLASSIVRPVEQLNRSALVIAGGDLSHRVKVQGTDEIMVLGDALNQMTTRIQHLEGMRRQYVSNVSHELRTPLASIRGMAETLIMHGAEDPDLARRYLPRIIAQTDRLARLASQLLDLAQIESGNLVATFREVRLASVIEDVVHTCGASVVERGVALQTNLPANLPVLQGDHDRLVQVFLNLVDNAARYTPAGNSIEVTAAASQDAVTVTVRDEGSGIPSEHLEHIFDRFYRVEGSRSTRTGGTGLGLSIVKQIVEAHQGMITAHSEAGKGTSFSVCLPRLHPSHAGTAAPSVTSADVPSSAV